MPKFRKKPIVVEANQWFKNGDHPLDGNERFTEGEFKGELYEGKVVRYYRHPYVSGKQECRHCGIIMHNHGWIDTLEGGHIVCPGDWIITGIRNEYYPCKDDIFCNTYEVAFNELKVTKDTDLDKLEMAKNALRTVAARIASDNIFNDVWWYSDCCTMLDYVEVTLERIEK